MRKFDYSNSEIPMYYNYDESVTPNNKDVLLFTKTQSHYAKSSLYFPLCVWGFGPVVRAARRFAVGEPSSSVQSVAASCSTQDALRINAELAISH